MLTETKLGNWICPDEDASCLVAYERYGDLSLYQSDELDCALKFVKNFRTAVDIGAHIGLISYKLSPLFQTVHGFEIHNFMFECLKKNKENFHLNNVEIYNNGIGKEEKSVDIVYAEGKSFSTHVDPNSVSGKYKIKSLDSFKFNNVDFLKIDAEGYESLIAQGALKTIIESKPVILYERKDHAQRYGFERDSIVEILEPHGYFVLSRKKNNFKFKKSNAIMTCDQSLRSLSDGV